MNKINEQKLDELLDRYIEQDATGQEEEQLMQMLDGIADEYMPEGMEQRLESFIEDLDDEETPVVALEPKADKGYGLTTYFRKYTIAACVVLAIGIGVAVNGLMSNGSNGFTDTCNSPAEAEAQLIKALSMVSSHTQKGMSEMRQRMETPAQPDYLRFIDFN